MTLFRRKKMNKASFNSSGGYKLLSISDHPDNSRQLRVLKNIPVWSLPYLHSFIQLRGGKNVTDRKFKIERHVFLKLCRTLAKTNHDEFNNINTDDISAFLEDVAAERNSKCMKREYVNIAKLLVLWLSAIGKLPYSAFCKTCLDEEERTRQYKIILMLGDNGAANLKLDFKKTCTQKLDVPVWAQNTLSEFLEFWKKNYYSSNYCEITIWNKGATLIRLMSNAFGISSFESITPDHLKRMRSIIYLLGSNTFTHQLYIFIKFLFVNNLISEMFRYAFFNEIKREFHQFSDEELKEFPEGKYSPEALYKVFSSVRISMEKIGYCKVAIDEELSWSYLYLYFIIKNGFSFSYESSIKWRAVVENKKPVASNGLTALFIAEKLLEGQDITPELLLEERSSKPRKREFSFLPWLSFWCNKYINKRRNNGIKESTIYNIKSSLNCFSEYLEQRNVTSMEDLSPEILSGFTSSNSLNYSQNTKNRLGLSVKHFLLFLAEERQISYKLILSLNINTVKPRQIQTKPLTEEQINEIYRFCKEADTEKGLRDALAFRLAFNLGLRSVDVFNIRFEQIDLKAKILKFRQRKTNRYIELPLPQSVLNALYKYLKSSRSNYKNENVIMRVKAPRCQMKSSPLAKTVKHLNCPHFKLHSLRKTMATMMLNAGVDFQLIADTLGHSDLKTVHVYLNTDKELLKECCFPIDGFEMH